MANFPCLPFELNAVITYLACASFKSDMRTEQIIVATCEGKISILFSKASSWASPSAFLKVPHVMQKTAKE